MTQLVPPDGIKIERILEELERGHVDLVERRDIAGLATRKTDRRTDGFEEGLHMRDRSAFGMFLHLLRISKLPDSDFAKSRTAISVIPGQFGHG